MGRVYLGEAAGPSGFVRRVVIKLVVNPESPELQRALVDEARIAAQLVHKNIVPVLDLGEEGGEQLVILEYVDGLDLRRWRGPLDWKMVAFIAAEVAAALDYAHRRTDAAGRPLGLVHRDVSPGNILLSWEGEVKLTDFGAAQLAQADDSTIRGNLAYMAPEQARGDEVDGRADLFALGVVMHEMLTGRLSFPGATIVSAKSRSLSKIQSELWPIIDRATRARPQERFISAAEMRAALLALPLEMKDPGRQLARELRKLREQRGVDTDVLKRAALGAGRPMTQVAKKPSSHRARVGIVVGAALLSMLAIGLALRAKSRAPERAPAKPAAAAPPEPVAAPQALGTLSVNALPWARIFVDGRSYGQTPRRNIALKTGSHQLKLVTAGGDERSRTIHISADRETRVSIDFTQP